MRILWDFRLFSYGYRDRGVGVFCRAMAKAIMEADEKRQCDIYIWGNHADVPAELAGYARRWIPYKKGAWKSDLFKIPLIIVRHRIQLFHYWVAMGPVFRIGMGLFHPCATCMTVHDLGVEQVRDHDFLEHVRGTDYWRFQKILLKGSDRIACNSQKTMDEVYVFTKANKSRCDVIYMPVGPGQPGAESVRKSDGRTRAGMFVALGGAPHKNVRNVMQGFSIFIESHPGFCLVVLGDEQGSENRKIPARAENAVFFEGMERYGYYLDNAAGLVACSTYEGLGIPLLEALAHGCPLIASDMPVFHETCGEAARFVNPLDAPSIAEGMSDVADHQQEWVKKTEKGYDRYKLMSDGAGKQWVELYTSLFKRKMR